MRTGGGALPARATSVSTARKSNNVGHFRGFLTRATFPSELSTKRVRTIPQQPAVSDLGGVHFLAQHGLDRVPPESHHRTARALPTSTWLSFSDRSLLNC